MFIYRQVPSTEDRPRTSLYLDFRLATLVALHECEENRNRMSIHVSGRLRVYSHYVEANVKAMFWAVCCGSRWLTLGINFQHVFTLVFVNITKPDFCKTRINFVT